MSKILNNNINIIEVNILENKLNQPYSYEADLSLYNKIEYGDLVLIDFNNSFKIGFVIDKKQIEKQDIKYNLKKVYKILKKSEDFQNLKNLILHIKSKIYANEKDIINLILNKNNYIANKLEIVLENQEKNFHKEIVQKYFENKIKIPLKKINKSDMLLFIELYHEKRIDIVLAEKLEKRIDTYSLNNSLYLRQKEFLKEYNLSNYKFKKLLKENKIKKKEILESDYFYNEKKDLVKFELTAEQIKAYNNIKKTNKISLLHGVTGSGKTYIYAKLIQDYLKQNQQILILVPEILLTIQLVKEFENIFQEECAFYHNSLTSAQKQKLLKRIKNNHIKIIIGTRSSIFLNIPNLALVIVDEEHDTSYKQTVYPYYHVDIMYDYWEKNNIKILLSSATPALLSYTKALRKVYKLVELKTRYKNFSLPSINYINYDDETVLEDLTRKIEKRIKKNKKILILYNVKGYSKYLQCTFCGHIPTCPNCNIPLKFYKSTKILECNFCDYNEEYTRYCSECYTDNFVENGVGIEKIYEFLDTEFKNKVLRIDSKVAKTKNKINLILSEFNESKNKILIGTQIISKGLNIKNLNHVIILNMDSMLYFSDFSTYELGYQLLEQVSGRSGRSEELGVVDVYTNNENHFIYQALKEHDYEMFFNEEIKNRKLQKTIPYYYICQIEVRSKHSESFLDKYLNEIRRNLEEKYIVSNTIIPYVKKIDDKFRRKIYVKYKNENIKKDLENILKNEQKINIYIDLDIRSYGY